MNVTLPDGTVLDLAEGATGGDAALAIGEGLARAALAIEVNGELRDLARLRLAGVMLDEKAYDEALAQLANKHGAAVEAQYAALKGDVLVAKNQTAEAKAAYKLALEKSTAKDGSLRNSVQLRLDALGG